MRRLALVALLLAPLSVLAQEGRPPQGTPPQGQPPAQPAPAAPRVSVDLESMLDGEAERPNKLQYYFWERLNNFGFRVDSARQVGESRFDQYIERRAARWQQQAPDAPPAALVITGRAACTYDNAAFFGQGQAHNFRGTIEVELKDGAGEQLARVALEHSWGRLPAQFTRAQVLDQYNDMIFTTALLSLLTHERVRSVVPAAKRADLATWVREQRDRVLRPLEENGLGDGQVAQALRALPVEPASGQ